jgi:hypothetical protein
LRDRHDDLDEFGRPPVGADFLDASEATVAAARLEFARHGASRRSVFADEGDAHAALGTIQRDKIIIPGGALLLSDAALLMEAHCSAPSSRATLGVLFSDAKGGGDGVTREFYSQLADALRTGKMMGEWLTVSDSSCATHPEGLFPRARGSLQAPSASYFRLLGRALAKCLADGFHLPIHLSLHFADALWVRLSGEALLPVGLRATAADTVQAVLLDRRLARVSSAYLPTLKALCTTARAISRARVCGGPEAAAAVALNLERATSVRISDLALEFEDPVTGCDLSQVPLCAGAQADDSTPAMLASTLGLPPIRRDSAVDDSNVDIWFAALLSLTGSSGISDVVDETLAGLSDVVSPPRALLLLSSSEFIDAACGSVRIEWDKTALQRYIELTGDYSRSSPVISALFEVLVAFSDKERSDFLRFSTGCPTLPQGGLANLVPPLKVMPKMDVPRAPRASGTEQRTSLPHTDIIDFTSASGAGASRRSMASPSPHDRALVSASTCFNTIRLPPYSSVETLRSQLLRSMRDSAGLVDFS